MEGRSWKGRLNSVVLHGCLLALGTMMGLASVEACVRLLGIAPDMVELSKGRFRLAANSKIAYEPIPNVDYGGESLDWYDYRGKSNILGFRGPVYEHEKSRDTVRIIVLGDSIAAGLRIDHYDDVFSARLESLLRGAGVRAEVMNLAVSGYNTQQEVETLKEKGLGYRPDAVIVAYCLNDRSSPYYYLLGPLLEQAKLSVGRRALFGHRLLYRSAAYRLVVERFRKRAAAGDLDYRVYDTGDTVAESLRELRRLSDENGFAVAIVVFPRFDDVSFGHYAYSAEHLFIANLSRDLGFAYLDLLPAMRECARDSSQSIAQEDLHPTAYGHACAASAIVQFMRDESFPR